VGVRDVMMQDPVEMAKLALGAPAEQARRWAARRRVQLYRDNVEAVLRQELDKIISDAARRKRIQAFAWMGCAQSVFKRVINEVAGPVYSMPPLRKVEPEQEAFDALSRECRLDAKMDMACRLVHATNVVALYFRYVERLGLVLDVLTPDQFTLIKDPDDPNRDIALIYDKPTVVNGQVELHHVYWDDTEAFELGPQKQIVPMRGPEGMVSHLSVGSGHPGIFPFVLVRLREPVGGQDDHTTGCDLEAAQSAIGFLTAMALRNLKVQGHAQPGIQGDPSTFPKDQVLDPENPIFAGEGNTLVSLHQPVPIDGYLKTIEQVALSVAANYGVNRDRLNQKTTTDADMVGLLERREQAIRLFTEVEARAFEVLRAVSQQHRDPALRLSDDATMRIDFAEISHKVERLKLLDIWERELKLGLRSVWDMVRQDNPEIRTDEEAQDEILRNTESFAWLVDLMRKLNIRNDANLSQPGQDARRNGEMGPRVRDGGMSRDDAAEQAETGFEQ